MYIMSQSLRCGPYAPGAWDLRADLADKGRQGGTAFLGGTVHLGRKGVWHCFFQWLSAALRVLPESEHRKRDGGRAYQ